MPLRWRRKIPCPQIVIFKVREFILRARKAPSTPDFGLDEIGRLPFLEIVAHCVCNALFYSRQIRPQTKVHVVLEGPAAPPKIVRLESDDLCSLGGYDERSIWEVLRRALGEGWALELEREVQVDDGLYVAKRSFESLVRQQCDRGPLYYLQPKGNDIRQLQFGDAATFVFTDHLSMPKKSDRFIERLGAQPINVGPKVLFASQCLVLVHNEMDRQGLE